MDEIPQYEKDMRAVWTTVCMMEHRITGDMRKATNLADEVFRKYAHALEEKIRRISPNPSGSENAVADPETEAR